MWTVVAMLAVLKAGGAFAPLDPDYPASRHDEVFRQTKARVVLASDQHATLCNGNNRIVVVVSRASLDGLTSASDKTNAIARPSNIAYVMFTSGSTGTPKGVVLEHRAISTSYLTHGEAFGFSSSTRSLQFAAYTFDACITEIITTLLFGACICIPSELDRRNDLSNTSNALGVSWALLTPTVARTLDPKTVSSLRTLVFGGEQVNSIDWEKWSHLENRVNAYGPTECSVICNSFSGLEGFYTGLIGKAIGSVSWVVDPNDHNKLAPLGSVGELLVEGPILARGYLGDAEKTAAAFIQDPTWLLEGSGEHVGRHGRLYKTGDLVHYDADGNLVYVGRKDVQVKVRGQRVELGEIEHHVRECMPEVERMAAEVIMPGNDKDKATVAVFVQQKEEEASAGDGSSARVFFPSQVDSQLSQRLPSYMVPGVYFAVAQLPMTTSGKTDRKRLREIGSAFSAQQLAELLTRSQGPKRQPSTEQERALQKLWARVLDIDADSIGLDDSFFRLGGDSITAMQVSSSARAAHISISTHDILQHKTIGRLVRHISLKPAPSQLVIQDPVNRGFGLTPIQELYFRLESSGRACFDQCFLLEVSSSVNMESLRIAFKTLVQRHSILRAQFSQRTGGGWQQHICDRADDSFTIEYVQSTDQDDFLRAMLQSRSQLDIQKGPILAAALFDEDQRQLLFITVHHLVIDLVSWRVLLEELEDLLISRELPAAPPIPFQAWQALQAKHANTHGCSGGIIQAEMDSKQLILSYWGVQPGTILHRSTVSKGFALDKCTTSAILGSCNNAFQTRPVELILSALIHSFAAAFPDRALPTIFNESHGRETWDSGIDLSRTVGWFTSMFPVQVPNYTRHNMLNVIRHTKDSMRQFNDNGRSYFASQFTDNDTANTFASMFPVEVMFNYQGAYQQLERNDSLFKNLLIPDGCEPASLLETPRFALIDVSVVIDRGCIHVAVISDSRVKHQQQIASWIEQYEVALVEMAAILQKRHPEWTLSDLPLAFQTYQDLDRFQKDTLAGLHIQPREVEDVFPCSPMQEGILVSQSKDSDAYWVSLVFEAVSTQHSQVSCIQLQQAWKDVVRRHSLLRTLLVNNVPGCAGTMNVVLKDPQPSISFFQAAGDTVTLEVFRNHRSMSGQQSTLVQQESGLQHHMSICQLDNGKVYLCLDINHAIFDAHSRGIVLRDLQTAYSAKLNPDSALFKDVVSYLAQQEEDTARAYWAKYLDGVEPCAFPSIANADDGDCRGRTVHVPEIDVSIIHAFCHTWDVTPATIIQTAWALVLGQYTRSMTPCFGMLSSGRDFPIAEVDKIFGPLITILPCRVYLGNEQTVLDVLRAVQHDYTSSLPHQGFSLARVHSMLGLGAGALFNTMLSLQRIDDAVAVGTTGVIFHIEEGADPTEYDVNIGVAYNRLTMEIEMQYKTRCMSGSQAKNVADSFSKAILSIVGRPHSMLGGLGILGDAQKRQLWTWNSDIPTAVERCVHELFADQAKEQPQAPAICAWDGEMTYGELDELSSRLARHLVKVGVEVEDVVPLCFEKSMWTVVAMLAVLKAGGAFAPLDPDYPASRHDEVFRQTKARVVLASDQHATLCNGNNRIVVVVSRASLDGLTSASDKTNAIARPSNIAYVMFTSGSTGTPKGVVLEHRAISTSCLTHGEAFGFSSSTRSLQFAAYTFDACITEIITTLLFGACICIPSELDRRNDLSNTSNALGVSWALLTPTVARTLDPKTVSSLRTLVLGGEQVNSIDWERWSHLEKQINTYGPTECSVWCTSHSNAAGFTSGTIGRLIASMGWVVDSNDHNKLAPLGSVGELLVEGPILARGYLGDAEKTAAAFIQDPTWLLEGSGEHVGRHGRLYKTGDLVHYDADGNLVYVGRKDVQVKVRGQRVELGEIEHHVRECMPEVERMAAEVIMPGNDKDKATVAVFVQQKEEEASAGDGSSARVFFPSQVDSQLSQRLPSYMVPGVYFAVAQLPMTTSGKTDRKRLREIGSAFSAQQLAELLTRSQGLKRQPSTEQERALQKLWARVLDIDADSIGLDDSFFRLGGDSIAAMRLVAEARQEAIHCTFVDIFHNPSLRALAHRIIHPVNHNHT
ncbi:EntF, Non-ribosomal peptide synthetase module protein [Pyrenophora tritici-repentis]|nr:EntF, Non-ribosomal peptide synthetase module protein [Pyrenophora tritici-repentis]